jgi:hypothetical protein
MPKSAKIILVILILLILGGVLAYLWKPKIKGLSLKGNMPNEEGIVWGIDFSQSQAEYLKLDWKKTYLAILDDLQVKNIKLHTNWDWIEGKKGFFYFKDTDWQVKQAGQHNASMIYVLGMKTGRWPECHIPSWAEKMPEDQVKAELMGYIKEVVERYKNSGTITYWQVENEPLFGFGACPDWYYKDSNFLEEEVALVKSLDPSRKVIISDSGELSSWYKAAQISDILGVTMYRNSWAVGTEIFGKNPYSFLNPYFYSKKAAIIKQLFGKETICIELQAEPWASEPLTQASMVEQLLSMSPEMFNENIAFAKQTGFKTFYLWGAEWWYWMKTAKFQPAIWEEAKEVFKSY